jgi:hypothetical protein
MFGMNLGKKLLSARVTGARQTALFIGRIRGRLSLIGRLAGRIHHNALVSFVFCIRRDPQPRAYRFPRAKGFSAR